MPIIYQKWIHRVDLQANTNLLYVFGDNTDRVGMGGQAKEMRGELNAVGVATKWHPTMDESAFFSDARIDEQKAIILNDVKPVVEWLKQGKLVVWPLDGIGSGLSEVPTRAPETWAWMEAVRKHLEKMRKV